MANKYYPLDYDENALLKFNPEAICDCRNCFHLCRLVNEPLTPIAQQLRDSMANRSAVR